ncbi:MAG: hypothetical protein HYT73_03445 [Candidatus Aenigmarchaeota archaeon]|nr:hypothetical protein [Candidatus Aenigmarchaeota archaeon]
MKIQLENLQSNDFYLSLNKDFIKKLLHSASNEKYPHRDTILAEKLNMIFSKKFNQSIGIKQWYYSSRNMPMSKLKIIIENSKSYSWIDVENNLISIKSFGLGFTKFIKPNFPIKDDINLGLVLGHIIGDGWINSKLSQPAYSNSNKELLNEFSQSMNYLFNVKPRIWVQKEKKFEEKSSWLKRIENLDEIKGKANIVLFYPKSTGILLFFIFGKFINNKRKNIPDIVFDLSLEFKSGLIRAIYDDESSVDIKSRHIRLYQDNPDILESIRKLLSNFGIKAAPIRKYIKRNKNRFYFGIYGYENFIKFQKHINFTSSEKRQKLSSLITRS